MASTFTLKSQEFQTRYMYVSCEQVKNVETNKSTINWTLSVVGGTSNYYTTGPTTVKINGQTVYYRAQVPYTAYTFPAGRGSISGSIEVEHDEEGKAEIGVSITTAIYYSATETKTGTWTLDDIPRAAKITSAPNFTDIDNPKITYFNAAGGSMKACISTNDKDADICAYRPVSGTEYTFTLTDTEREKIWDATIAESSASMTLYFRLETTIGSYIGYHSVPVICSIANPNPIISITAQDVYGYATSLTGDPNKIIRGYNNIEFFVDANPVKNADIESYYVINGDYVSMQSSGNIRNTKADTITYAVRDNRNIRVEKQYKLDIIDYFPVSCSHTSSIQMSGETTARATIKIEGSFFNESFGAVHNELSLFIEYDDDMKPIPGTPTFSNGKYSLTYTTPDLPYDKPFVFSIYAEDLVSGISTTEYTLQIIPVFDWGKEDFNFNVPVSFNGQQMNDFVVEQGISNGWTYKKWNSGTAECWRRLQITTAVSTQWGSSLTGGGALYTSGSLSATNLRYPFTFTETPILTVSLMPFGSGALLMAPGNGYGSESQTGPFEIARGTSSASGQYLLAYHAMGTWK